MLPKHHALAAGVVAVALRATGRPLRPLLLFTAAAVLIDADHYVGYVATTGDFSLARAYDFHHEKYIQPRSGKFQPRLPPLGIQAMRAFHSVPFLILLALLARRWPFFWPFLLGCVFHRIQDELWSWFE